MRIKNCNNTFSQKKKKKTHDNKVQSKSYRRGNARRQMHIAAFVWSVFKFSNCAISLFRGDEVVKKLDSISIQRKTRTSKSYLLSLQENRGYFANRNRNSEKTTNKPTGNWTRSKQQQQKNKHRANDDNARLRTRHWSEAAIWRRRPERCSARSSNTRRWLLIDYDGGGRERGEGRGRGVNDQLRHVDRVETTASVANDKTNNRSANSSNKRNRKKKTQNKTQKRTLTSLPWRRSASCRRPQYRRRTLIIRAVTVAVIVVVAIVFVSLCTIVKRSVQRWDLFCFLQQ